MCVSTDTEAIQANAIKSAVHKVIYSQTVSGQQRVCAEPLPWGKRMSAEELQQNRAKLICSLFVAAVVR
jgi:hypothetical protein